MSSSHVGDHGLQYAEQVGTTDNQTHIETAAGIVNEARRKLYQLLAEA